jgi:isopenicillin N synthase-like dioxygenase
MCVVENISRLGEGELTFTGVVPWADLLTLDLEEFDKGTEARQRLAEVFLESVHTTGFLYVVNHGVSPKAVARQADIANTLLESTEEEKKPFFTTKEQAKVGRFSGFKTPELSAAYSLHSTLDYYNFPRLHNDICDEMDDHIPAILEQHLEEVKDVTMHLHKVVFRKLLILLAMALKAPLHTYTNLHIWEAKSDSYFRYVKYDPRTEEDNAKHQDLFLPGHTDSGSLTFLFNQQSAGLQILDPQGQWKYVKYVEGSLIVNVGEALSHLTGGYLKPTIHRVVKPPKDQERNRLALNSNDDMLSNTTND